MLHFSQPDTFDEFVEDVRSITVADIQTVSAQVFDEKKLSSLAFFPES